MKLDNVTPTSEALGKIAPQPWMTAPETRAVWDALTAQGTQVRFIGGCVRDAILKRPIRDIDIATPDPPGKVMVLLRRAGIHAIPTGIDHGTVTAVVEGVPFEITTLRVDVETDGRRAKVAFTDDWIADASRRDFTINTFSCNMNGDVYDPFNGLDDLAYGRVRFVGNPRDRIQEDVLRLLRFFRFYATYGRPPADAEALAACRLEAHKLPILSGERVRVEMFRILMSPNPADVVVLMQGERVLEHVLPEAGNLGRLRVMSWLDSRAIRVDSVHPNPILRLVSLLRTDRAGAEAVADRFRLSNDQRRRLVDAVAAPWPVDADSDEKTLRHALYRQGADTVRDLLLLAWAQERSIDPRQPHARTQAWLDHIAYVDAWRAPEFPLKGRDALDLGVPRGPDCGRALKAVQAWWEDEDYRPDRTACLKKLRAEVGSGED